jgi:hypothetical protein
LLLINRTRHHHHHNHHHRRRHHLHTSSTEIKQLYTGEWSAVYVTHAPLVQKDANFISKQFKHFYITYSKSSKCRKKKYT